MNAEDYIKEKLTNHIEEDKIILDRFPDPTGKLINTISVDIKTFAEMFKDQIELNSYTDKASALEQKSKDDNLGYEKYIKKWKEEHLI